MINKITPYGNYFKIYKNQLSLMINGRMFTIFKGCNSNKWKFDIWDNIYRKYKVPIDSKCCIMRMPNSVYCFFALE